MIQKTYVVEFTKFAAKQAARVKGRRREQRSVRLNKAYRVIYEEYGRGDVVIVGIQEVNKHDY